MSGIFKIFWTSSYWIYENISNLILVQERCWISIDRRTERGRKQNIVAGFVTRVRRSEAGNLRQIAVNQRQECLIESFDRSVKGLAGDVIGSVANQDRRGEGWDMIQPIEHPAKNTRPRWSICYWSFSLGSQLLWRPCILNWRKGRRSKHDQKNGKGFWRYYLLIKCSNGLWVEWFLHSSIISRNRSSKFSSLFLYFQFLEIFFIGSVYRRKISLSLLMYLYV